MTMEYKGYTLNTNGDNNWGNKELNVHKKLIDENIKIDAKVDVSESFINSIKTSVQNGYTRKILLTGGVPINILEVTPVYSEYRIIVRPYPLTDNSMYMGICEFSEFNIGNSGSNYSFIEKVKTGTYITNTPLVEYGGITTVDDAEVEVIITYSALY